MNAIHLVGHQRSYTIFFFHEKRLEFLGLNSTLRFVSNISSTFLFCTAFHNVKISEAGD